MKGDRRISPFLLDELKRTADNLRTAKSRAREKAESYARERGDDPADALGYTMAMELGALQAEAEHAAAELDSVISMITDPPRARRRR